MTIAIRRAAERGHADHGWLDTRHTFSFADYFDPAHMGFRSLRVINEDRVQRGAGFPTHAHRDMEILSMVLDGALEHRDSMGTGSVIYPGELQRMSAGSGVTHSERNAGAGQLHFLQIWIIPERPGVAPSYEQRAFPESERSDRLRLVASRDGREGSLTVHQDADLYAGLLTPGAEVVHEAAAGRGLWLHVVRGAVTLAAAHELAEGDGAAIEGTREVLIASTGGAEILLFDLA